jgi:uncharacterized membrane protein YgcG
VAVQRIPRWQKFGALLPMSMLAMAWGISLTNSGLATAVDADGANHVPDVPLTAFEQPASVEPVPPGIGKGGAQAALRTLAGDGIPSTALAAYQRAETLLGQADPACHLPWTLVAAIGRVESNHGRYGGSSLDNDGVATPSIIGVALTGRDTAKVNDTDGGALDGDALYDHAIGPMQFIPGTWDAVAVDADGDSHKNPQDIDDAATAAGIYLCSGVGDLGTVDGARAAVMRYNRSANYADLVLAIAQQYATGNFATTPNNVTAPSGAGSSQHSSSGATAPRSTSNTTSGATGGSTGTTDTSGGSSGGGSSGGSTPASPPPAPAPAPTPAPDPLTWAEAQVLCLAQGISALDVLKLTVCINNLL